MSSGPAARRGFAVSHVVPGRRGVVASTVSGTTMVMTMEMVVGMRPRGMTGDARA